MLTRRLLQVANVLRHWWWRWRSPITLGVRAIVIDDDGMALLVRHSYGRPVWHLPGGGVHRRERLGHAIRRELMEEVGVEVEDDDHGLELLGLHTNLHQGRSDHIAVFLVARWSSHPASSGEIDEAEFFDPDQLPADVSSGTRRRIDEWRGRRARSLHW